MSRPVVAIAGNPNSGKTTLFNRLTGANAKVGNYPGITVERKEGTLRLPDGRTAVVLDIPGTYSLSARTAEEQIAITAIAGLNPYTEPDAVVVVVDSTQLARNLYLALQVIELRLKVVVALNMSDIVRKARMRIDVEALSTALGGAAVVPISASRGEGIDELEQAIDRVLQKDAALPASRADGGAATAAGASRWPPGRCSRSTTTTSCGTSRPSCASGSSTGTRWPSATAATSTWRWSALATGGSTSTCRASSRTCPPRCAG
jgi:small GTP-binding protein